MFLDVLKRIYINGCRFLDDGANQTQRGNAPKNFETLLRIVINILKRDARLKGSLAKKAVMQPLTSLTVSCSYSPELDRPDGCNPNFMLFDLDRTE